MKFKPFEKEEIKKEKTGILPVAHTNKKVVEKKQDVPAVKKCAECDGIGLIRGYRVLTHVTEQEKHKMAIDVLKQHIPGILEHGVVSDATVTLTGTVSLPTSQALTSPALTTATVPASSTFTFGNAANIVLGTGTGTKIGTTTTQKLSFMNATPIAQYAVTGSVATTAAGATTTVHVNTTFTGDTGTLAYTVADCIKCLKAYGLLAS